MPVISIETAMQHLRAEEADQSLVQAYLDAAEESASKFMGRKIFADEASLAVATSGADTALAAARASYETDIELADQLSDEFARNQAKARATRVYNAALYSFEMIADGIVLTPAITAGCLLILGHLYEHREDVILGTISNALPHGSQSLLHPYRVGMGV